MTAPELDFDPYDAEIRNCWCELCMALASAVQRGGYSWRPHAERLHDALVAGAHVRRGPKVSLTKVHCYRGNDGFSFMQYGLGIGVTTGGVGGARRLPARQKAIPVATLAKLRAEAAAEEPGEAA